MKKTLLLALLFSSHLLFAQEDNYAPSKPGKDIPEEVIAPHEIHFTGIDTVVGTKDELFVKANEWIALAFKNANAVIQVKDKEAGKLVGKGTMQCMYGTRAWAFPITVQFVVTIDVKDRRYRYEFSDFWAKSYESRYDGTIEKPFDYANKPKGLGFQQEKWQAAVENCRARAEILKNSLQDAMKQKAKDW